MFAWMQREAVDVMSIPVSSMPKWIETGLMLFDVRWLQDNNFVERYDWKMRSRYPGTGGGGRGFGW